MTESRRNRPQSPEDFVVETVREIERLREEGVVVANDIANALNRAGNPDFQGRQWNGEAVLRFLSSRDARMAEARIRRGG